MRMPTLVGLCLVPALAVTYMLATGYLTAARNDSKRFYFYNEVTGEVGAHQHGWSGKGPSIHACGPCMKTRACMQWAVRGTMRPPSVAQPWAASRPFIPRTFTPHPSCPGMPPFMQVQYDDPGNVPFEDENGGEGR